MNRIWIDWEAILRRDEETKGRRDGGTEGQRDEGTKGLRDEEREELVTGVFIAFQTGHFIRVDPLVEFLSCYKPKIECGLSQGYFFI